MKKKIHSKYTYFIELNRAGKHKYHQEICPILKTLIVHKSLKLFKNQRKGVYIWKFSYSVSSVVGRFGVFFSLKCKNIVSLNSPFTLRIVLKNY